MSEIKEQVQNFIHKYLDVSPEAEAVIADYALQTWRPLPNLVKYLQFIGDYSTGRTRAGAVMAAICRNAFKTSVNASSSSLVAIIDERGACVPIFDETDSMNDEVSVILKVGSMKDQKIIKMMEHEGKYVPVSFDVFGYKVILSRKPFRDVALEARCITVKMTGTDRNDIPRVLNGDFEKDSAEIQQALSAFYVGVPALAL